MSKPNNILQEVRRKVQSVTYGNPLYRMVLDQGPVPDRLRLLITDPWPGDAQAGQHLITAQPGLFEQTAVTGATRTDYLITHQWLRDLRAVGTDKARKQAEALISDWLQQQDEWHESSWAPDILGDRLANWIAFYAFYAPHTAVDFKEHLFTSMARQLRHLLRSVPVTLTGVAGLRAIKGLLYGGLGLLEGEKALSLAHEFLQRQLNSEILADGGHISRNPSEQLQMLRYLIDIRTALRATQMEVPHELQAALERMAPALKLYRHGDGGLALFHGAHEDNVLQIDTALNLAEVKSRVQRRLPQSGYERIIAGRSLLLVDVGAPAPSPYDTHAHAGLLSFEFSIGRERLIVNCGAGPEQEPDWRLATAATAAHSTLTLMDTNACEVIATGGLGNRNIQTSVQRYEQDDVHHVEMTHDGYAHKYRIIHHRALSLTGDGEELRGREILSGQAGRDFTIRWHLHPNVQASLLQGGQAALLRTAGGSGWRLKIEGGDLGLEASIYCGGPIPRRSLQLKANGRMQSDPTVISWALTREKKG